jgi:hypothetical protein
MVKEQQAAVEDRRAVQQPAHFVRVFGKPPELAPVHFVRVDLHEADADLHDRAQQQQVPRRQRVAFAAPKRD